MINNHNQSNQSNQTNMPINNKFRVSFSKNLSDKMNEFSNTHQTKSSKEFRQEWQKWINLQEIQSYISETVHQNHNHHTNTLYDKIYESMRYHRRKTPKTTQQNTPPTTPTTPTRKKSTTFSQGFINVIIQHVEQHHTEKPENAYTHFRENNTEYILQEKQYLLSKYDKTLLYDLDHEHQNIHYNKFKRNYKNIFQNHKNKVPHTTTTTTTTHEQQTKSL